MTPEERTAIAYALEVCELRWSRFTHLSMRAAETLRLRVLAGELVIDTPHQQRALFRLVCHQWRRPLKDYEELKRVVFLPTFESLPVEELSL
jgi:hypothetical protein